MEENIALRAADIDGAAVLGYNSPIFTGRPMFWANTLGIAQVVQKLDELAREQGNASRPSPLLIRMAAENKMF